MSEFSSGYAFTEGDSVRDYRIVRAFDPGRFAFAGMAQSAAGRRVFFKKYRRPGGASPWYDKFVAYQNELKTRIQADAAARSMCYEFIEFFEMSKGAPLRAFYQVFEWVEGGTDLRGVLQQLQKASDAFDWKQRVIFAKVMLAGVNALHRAGVIHTDLKPENFYLIPDNSITAKYKLRVIDLDFSILDGKKPPWHGVEGYVGTPGYMSPEHIPEKASDVFTCGLMLGELLGGGHPSADNFESYDERIKKGDLRRIALEQPISEAADTSFLEGVINAALRPEPARRPTAEQLLSALNGRLAEFDGTRPGAALARPAPARSVTPPVVKTNPESQAVPEGTSVRFGVLATGASRAYQWRRNGAPIAGATTDVYAIAAVAPADAGTYDVSVSNAGGTVLSAAATLTVVPRAMGGGALTIEGPGGRTLMLQLETTLGRDQFRQWSPDFEKFMAARQFRVFRDDEGLWMIEHCAGAKNMTKADGSPLDGPKRVGGGIVIALGASGKCPLTLRVDAS